MPPVRGPVFRRKDQRRNVQRYARGLSVRAPAGSPGRRGPPSGGSAVVLAWRSAGHPRGCGGPALPPPRSGSSPRARGGGGGFPPARRACGRGTCAPGPLRWPGRRRAAVVVGPGLRRPGPSAAGRVRSCPSPPVSGPHPPYWAGSPFPRPCRGPRLRPWGPAATPAGEDGGGRQRAGIRPAFGGVAAPRRSPRWWGCVLFRAALLPFGPGGESCRKVSNLVKPSLML